MKTTLLLLSLIFATVSMENADAIIGVWKNATGKGHIQIYKSNNRYYGKIIWLKNAVDNAGRPKLDHKNTDPGKRNHPLIGLVMLRGFTFDDGEWNGGMIYNPSDGKEYKAFMKLKTESTLLVRGYVGLSVIGKTDTWTRVR